MTGREKAILDYLVLDIKVYLAMMDGNHAESFLFYDSASPWTVSKVGRKVALVVRRDEEAW